MATEDSAIGARTMKASEFKARCLKLMDEVAESGEEIVITKYGRPISRLVPYMETPKSFFGADKGRMKIIGDIVSPMPAEWFDDPDDSRKKLF